MGPARVLSLALLFSLCTFHGEANPVVTSADETQSDITVDNNNNNNNNNNTTLNNTTEQSSSNDTDPKNNNVTQQQNFNTSTTDNNTTITSTNNNITTNDNTTTTDLPPTTPQPLTRCRYEFQAGVRNNLFVNDEGEVLPLLTKRFTIHKDQTRCYLTREDFEDKLDTTSESEAIIIFTVGCLDEGQTEVVLKDEEEEDDDWVSSQEDGMQTTTTSSSPGRDDSMGQHGSSRTTGEDSVSSTTPSGDGTLTTTTMTTTVADDGMFTTPHNASTTAATNKTRSGRRYYHNYISYLQGMWCRMSVRVVAMVANMTDLRVLSVFGHRAWDLGELAEDPELCNAFTAVKSFNIISDPTAPSYLHHLARCTGRLDNVAEMVLHNDSLTALPDFFTTALPNLRALELNNNRLTDPVLFPWRPGFAELPRNLSRTFQFNDLYNFRGSFDMPRHLFRRVLLLDGNNISSLNRGFQFTSDFQYISLQRNGLREIAEDVFDLVPGLQYLSLAHNKLTSLPAKLFAKLTALKKLDLQGNRLQAFPDALFSNTRRLEKLNAEGNALEVLQEGLFTRLQELTELKLKNNSIRHLAHGALSMMSVKLKLLELQHNPLTAFPVIVLELRGLQHTHLEYTDIQVLDFVGISEQTSVSRLAEALKNPTTGEVTNLEDTPTTQRVIYLRYSKLRSVLLYNGTRDTLRIFMLVIKHFTILMEGSQLACDCHILNVTHQLKEWRAEGKLTGAEACLEGWNCAWPSELSGKKVARLEDEQTYCPLEEEGAVGRSGSTSCPEGCACYVRTTVETVIVDCKHSGLISMPPWVPANTRELWLQNNSIKTVPRLSYLSHLHALKLTANNVQELPAEVVRFMSQLGVLHVDDNWMTSLVPDLGQLGHLYSVRLAGNPFRCDCRTVWLKDWLLRHKTEAEDWYTIKCSTDEKDGRFFTLVPDSEFVCKVSASLGELAVPIAVPLIFAFLLLTLTVVGVIQRRRLKVLLYIHTGMHPFDTDPPDHRALYDVSVCCDVTARAWVLRHLIEALEEGGRYKVFFYSRDAFVGFTTSENVRHCVRNSKRLVVVLGKGWEDSDLLLTATKEGLSRCQKEMVHFMTVVVHNFSARDIANKHVQQYVQRGRYISTEDKHFTKKLLYEMPHLKATKKPGPQKETDPEKAAQQDPEKKPKDTGKAAKKGAKPGKAVKKQRDSKNKGKREGSPEPVALYDIVAAAENEQNDMMEPNAFAHNNRGYCNNERNSEQNPVFNRQLSLNDLQLNLKNSSDTGHDRANSDQTRSNTNHLAPPVIFRQDSEHPSVISDDLFGDDTDDRSSRHNDNDDYDRSSRYEGDDGRNAGDKDDGDGRGVRNNDNDDGEERNARDNDGDRNADRNGDTLLVANNPVFNKQISVESQAGRQARKSVFVWYADKDLQYTLKNIVEPLEKRGHACILQDRDFPLGAAIQENIVHAAETCTRSIFVLSDHTPQNEWFTFVFHVTFDRQMQSRDHRVALVTREEVDVTKFVEEIQQVLKTSALLAESDPWFWKRLNQFVNFDGYEIC